MSNITPLRGGTTHTNEPNKVLIGALKDILADAESGRLQSLCAVGFLADGLRMSCIVGPHNNVYEVIGSIEMLKLDYINNHTEKL